MGSWGRDGLTTSRWLARAELRIVNPEGIVGRLRAMNFSVGDHRTWIITAVYPSTTQWYEAWHGLVVILFSHSADSPNVDRSVKSCANADSLATALMSANDVLRPQTLVPWCDSIQGPSRRGSLCIRPYERRPASTARASLAGGELPRPRQLWRGATGEESRWTTSEGSEENCDDERRTEPQPVREGIEGSVRILQTQGKLRLDWMVIG